MRYRKLGNTGLIVSEMCLGAMTFGSGEGMWATVAGVSQEGVTDLIKTALDRGINFIDTADFYSNGRSEVVTGHALKMLGQPRDSYVLATKVLLRMGAGSQPDRAVALPHHGEHRCQPEAAAGGSHRSLPDPRPRSVHAARGDAGRARRLRARRQGALHRAVQSLGLGNHEIASGSRTRRNLARFESLQMYYSLAGRDIEREIVPLAKDQNLAILPWSPLAGGLLSGKFSRENEKPDGARRATLDFPPVDRERVWRILDVLRPIAADHLVSVAQVALAWLLAQPHVTSVIIGAKNQEQLLDNVAATELELSPEQLKADQGGFRAAQ